jgi:hypothetical protein
LADAAGAVNDLCGQRARWQRADPAAAASHDEPPSMPAADVRGEERALEPAGVALTAPPLRLVGG